MFSRKSYAIAGAAAGWLAGSGYRRFKRDLDDADLRISRGSVMAHTAYGAIEYAQQGAGEPMLVVHGAGGGFDQGLLFGSGLADRGFAVTAMSRFGYLRTALPKDATPQAQADAHASLLDTLQIQQAAIIGVSAGSPSAVQFAIRHPRRCSALILLVPLIWSSADARHAAHKPARAAELMLRWLVGSDLIYWSAMRFSRDLLIRTVLGTPPSLVKAAQRSEQRRIDEVLRSVLPLSSRAAGLRNDARVATSLERYQLESIQTPTLIIALRDDLYGMFDGARYTAQHIHGARFIEYDRGGHLWVGHQDAVMDAVATFAGAVSKTELREGRNGR